MTDVDTEIRERLRGEVGAADTGAPPFASLVRRAARRRRRRRALAASATAAVLAAGTLVLTDTRGGDQGVDTVSPGSTSTTADPSDPIPPGAIVEAPPPPLEVRGNAAVAWTGQELVVWGGDVEAFNMGLPGEDRAYDDGAAYDPSTGEWRKLSPSPLPGNTRPPRAAMTDRGLAIVRGTEAALWHPEDNTWEQLPAADRTMVDLHSDGGLLVSVSGQAILELGEARAWEAIPPLPERLERPASAWSGDSVLTIGGPGTPFTQAVAYRFDLDQRAWEATAPPPDGLHAEALAADWDGRRVVVANYDMQAATYDPTTDRWTRLPDVPARFSEWAPTVTSTDGVSLVGMAYAIVVLTPDDRWIPVPLGGVPAGEYVRAPLAGPLGRALAWTINAGEARNELTILDVDALATAWVQVGVAALALPPDVRVDAAELASEDVVWVDLSAPTGACTATTDRSLSASSPVFVVEEDLDNDGRPVTWIRSEDGRRWAFAISETDEIQIECDDAATARRLAEGASFDGSP